SGVANLLGARSHSRLAALATGSQKICHTRTALSRPTSANLELQVLLLLIPFRAPAISEKARKEADHACPEMHLCSVEPPFWRHFVCMLTQTVRLSRRTTV